MPNIVASSKLLARLCYLYIGGGSGGGGPGGGGPRAEGHPKGHQTRH